MNIVFLDIDGVLGHKILWRARQCSQLPWDAHSAWIDNACVARLNRLVTETGAVVVISSSWRIMLGAPRVAEVLRECGFTGVVIGETPDHSRMPDGTRADHAVSRWTEIEAWLLAHPTVERYVILDDCEMDDAPQENFVRTDDECGLTGTDVDIAIRILSDDWRDLEHE